MTPKRKAHHKWASEDPNKLLNYNGLDTCATARVARNIIMEPDFNDDRVQQLWQVHTDLSHLAAEMHTTGFPVYHEGRRALLKQLRMLSTRRHNELLRHVEASGHSPAFEGTDHDMRALLYKRHAKKGIHCYDIPEPDVWDDDMWTNEEKTTLSVDKGALLRIYINPEHDQEVRDAIQFYWRAKAPGKAISTWVDSKSVNEHIGEDGRMRAEWNSSATETMRFASELMTLPEDKDDSQLGGKLPNIRGMYCASPGWKLKHWDWSQQEIRMYLAIYKDPALREALASGNVYVYDARQWFPQQLEQEFGKEWRTVNLKKEWKNGYRQCKVIHLGSQYLAGPAVIWVQGLLQDRSLRFHAVRILNQKFHQTYAVSIANAAREHERVSQCGYSEGRLLGGRRHYPAPPPVTETCNYPVQRTAGEMGAIAKLRIWKTIKAEGLPARVLTDEHDAGTIEFLPEPAVEKELDHIIKESTQGPWRIEGEDHMFPVAYHVGDTWAEACDDNQPETASY